MDAAATVIVPTELIEPVDLPPTPRALYRQEPAKPSTETARAVPLDQDGEDFNLDFDTDDLNASPAPQANANRSQNSSKPASPQQEPVDGDREFIELGTPADDDADAFDQEFERNLGIGSANDGIDDDSDIRDDDDSGDSMPQLHTVFLDEDIPPGAAVDPALRAARAKQRRSLVMGCILLLLTGLVLATYVLRIELARLYPGLRAPLEQACQYFSCDVPYPRDADEVLLVGSDLTQATDPKGGYHLAITVRNHARYPVAWPQLEITLTDRFERALTRRVLEPKEWLPANVAQHPAFEAQGELTAQITLASDSQVMGYRLGVFYR